MSKEHVYWVYILASELGGTLYIGVTSNLVRRMYEHRMEVSSTALQSSMKFIDLVYFEQHTDIEAAICGKSDSRRWNRAWKI